MPTFTLSVLLGISVLSTDLLESRIFNFFYFEVTLEKEKVRFLSFFLDYKFIGMFPIFSVLLREQWHVVIRLVPYCHNIQKNIGDFLIVSNYCIIFIQSNYFKIVCLFGKKVLTVFQNFQLAARKELEKRSDSSHMVLNL